MPNQREDAITKIASEHKKQWKAEDRARQEKHAKQLRAIDTLAEKLYGSSNNSRERK